MSPAETASISPTAHYTGYVWLKNGLSHPAFYTRQGLAFYTALRPFNRLSRSISGATLEAMLLARHRVIDHLLMTEIESGRVSQVVEVAAGLSPRGYRFTERYPDVRYLEADLTSMAERKRRLIERAGLSCGNLEVVVVNALADEGEHSLFEVGRRNLDPGAGTALITEGLLGYFPVPIIAQMWERFARFLGQFPHGLYLSDLHCEEDVERVRGAFLFKQLLARFSRSNMSHYFADARAARDALEAAGFETGRVHLASDFGDELEVPGPRQSAFVRIVEAKIE